MKKKFLEMFSLQDKLNTNTNGAEWTKGVTLQGRPINWYRCMYMEAAEAIDSLNWKHWKDINKSDDLENVKIELVDIWHFLMSQSIVNFKDSKLDCVEDAYDAYLVSKGSDFRLTLMGALEGILINASTKSLPLEMFFVAVSLVDGFSMDDVYSLYIGKNCLNQFRQDNGYKNGTYVKIWDRQEDNVYMQKILNDNPDIAFAELYALLDSQYKKITG